MGKGRDTSSDDNEVREDSKECRCVPECISDRGHQRPIHIVLETPSESPVSEETEDSSSSEQSLRKSIPSPKYVSQKASSTSSSSSRSLSRKVSSPTSSSSSKSLSQKASPSTSSSSSKSLPQKVPTSTLSSSRNVSDRHMNPSELAAHDCKSIPSISSDREALQKGGSVRSVAEYNVYSYGPQQAKSMYTVSTKRPVPKRSGNGSMTRQMVTTERTKVGLFELSIERGPGGKQGKVTPNLSADIAKDLDFHLDGTTKPTGPMEGVEQEAVGGKSKKSKSIGFQPDEEKDEKLEDVPEKSRMSGSRKKSKSMDLQQPEVEQKKGEEQEILPEKSKKSGVSRKSRSAGVQMAGEAPQEEEQQEIVPEKSRKSGVSKKSRSAGVQLAGEAPQEGEQQEIVPEKSRKSGLSKKPKSAALEPAGDQPEKETTVEASEVTVESELDSLDNLLLKYMYKMKKTACRNMVTRDDSLVDSTIQMILKEEVPSKKFIGEKISKNSRGLCHELIKLNVEMDAINDFANFLHGQEKATAYDCEKNSGRGGLPKFTSVSIHVMKKMMASVRATVKELSNES